jgi:polyphosphate kinase 2 (PPK2 family)
VSKSGSGGDEKAAAKPRKISTAVYEAELYRLQIELVKLQEWTRSTGARIVVASTFAS